MNIKDFKVGMYIKISEDPSKSIKLFKGSFTKRNIAGTIQKVAATRYESNAIRVEKNSKLWTIHFDDIIKLTPLPKIKPETFDPKQLIIQGE